MMRKVMNGNSCLERADQMKTVQILPFTPTSLIPDWFLRVKLNS